jgi:hypothetical protein
LFDLPHAIASAKKMYYDKESANVNDEDKDVHDFLPHCKLIEGNFSNLFLL